MFGNYSTTLISLKNKEALRVNIEQKNHKRTNITATKCHSSKPIIMHWSQAGEMGR